ncbi:MAG: response regulator [Deltaproteobacteria bacterium]|jgi:two-component system response regulator YesN|nr:response regulator [Deltaproteobacteria bacterium]
MIVDSDPLQRLALSAMIARVEGFTVINSTGDFKSALNLCLRDKPDLALIDMVVPWMTGLDLAKEMIAAREGISVFVMSAHDYGEVVNHVLGLNITGFISKPISPEELATILIRHKRSRAPRPSPLFEKIRALVKDKDFGAFCRELRSLANALRLENNSDPVLINERLATLWLALAGDRPDSPEPDPQGQPFPLDDVSLLTVAPVVELCLFAIADRAFRQNAAKRGPRLKKVFDHIEANLELPLGLNALVENCHISQGHLSRTFKKHFSVSVMEYIHLKKIALAKALFLFSEKSMAEVAEMIGYNERSYFGKVFKKYENSTIQQFRQLTVRADTQAALAMGHSQWKLLLALGGQNLQDLDF